MSGSTFSFQDALGGGAGPAAPAAAPAPQAFSFADAQKPATPQFASVPVRQVQPNEPGYQPGAMTNLSPEDYARFQSGQGPATPAPPAVPASALGASATPRTGLVANIGAGTSEAAADTLGAPVDLATGALNLASRGVKAATGLNLGQIQNPVGGSNFFKSAEGLVGADPRNVAPADGVEQLGRAAGSGAPSALLPWSVARALPVMGGLAGAAQRAFGAGSAATQAGAGAAGGATGQVAQNAAPAPLKPIANLLGNLLGGGLTLGGVAATKALIDSGQATIGNLMAPLTTAGQQRLAGARIAAASSDPAALRGALATPQTPLVPGSLPTTFQATGGTDAGLGQLERATATRSPQLSMQRAADQNAARVSSLQAQAPADASPEAVGTAFRQQLAAIDSQGAAAEQAARGNVQQSVTAMGGAVPAGADQQATRLQQYGQLFRGQAPDPEAGTAGAGLAGGNATAKAAEGRLWQAIDPDGTLRVDMAPVRDQAAQLMQATPKNARPLDGEPAAILATARLQPAVQSFSELAVLRGRITDVLPELRQAGQNNTVRIMSHLLDSVHDAMAGSVEQRAAQESAAVASGAMDPEQTMAWRVNAYGERTAGASQVAAGRVAGDATPPMAGSGMADAAGVYRTGRAAGIGPGGAARGAGLSAAARPSAPSLLTFLIRRGGLQDSGGELAAMDARKIRIGLVRKSGGESFDYAREAAEEAGYLPAGSDINDLLDAVSNELHGRPVYPAHVQAEMDGTEAARDAVNVHERDLDQARERVQSVAELMGGRLSPAEVEHAANLSLAGLHPQEAIEQAAMHSENRALDVDAARQSWGPEGVRAGAQQTTMDLPGNGGAPDQPANFDAEAAARYQAARARTAQRYATYVNAPGVGEVLAPGRTAGTFLLGDSRVPSTLFPAGSGAAERAQAFVRAGGNVQNATDYLAFDLRRAAEKDDGTLDAGKFKRWMDSRAETFAALPGTEARFADAGRAQQALDGAMARRVEARDAYEKSAAGQFLGDGDPVTKVGRILNGDRAVPIMQELARLTERDPPARAGLQRAVVDYVLRDLRGNASFSDGMPTALKADAYQTFIRKTPAALAQIFSPEQVKAMQAVAADLQQAARSIASTKPPGVSNTAQDLAGGAAHGGGHQSVLTQVVIAEALGGVAEHVAGPLGKIAGIGTLVLSGMRQAGLTKVDDLVAQAMLHPEVARTLLSKAPNRGSAVLVGQMLRAQLRALALRSAATSGRREPDVMLTAPGAGMTATPRSAPPVSAWRSPVPFGFGAQPGMGR